MEEKQQKEVQYSKLPFEELRELAEQGDVKAQFTLTPKLQNRDMQERRIILLYVIKKAKA